MSTPPTLTLPPGVVTRSVQTPRGAFAALHAEPELSAGATDDAVPTAVLIPGFTGSKEDFIAVLAPLARAGFRVLAYDQRGQYESPGDPPPEGWVLDAFATDALAVCAQAAPGPVHLLGHSFGGLVARAAALAQPDAFASLTLLGSGPAGLTGRQAELLRQMAETMPRIGLAATWAVKYSLDVENGWQPPEDPAVADFLERRFLANDTDGLAAIARLLTEVPDRTQALRDTGLPVLVACGEDDDVWSPKLQSEMASQLGAPCVFVPGAAHSPAAENAEETARVLAQFWSSLGRGPLDGGGAQR